MNGWRPLHPAALVVSLIQSVKAAISLFILLFFGMRLVPDAWRAWSIPAFIAVAALAALAPPLAHWATTRYRLGDDSIMLTSGVVFRQRRTIGYDNIHAISSTSPFYMQPFNVVQLVISTGGTTDADITLDAVPAALQLELETLRAAAQADPDPTGAGAGTGTGVRAANATNATNAADAADTADAPAADAPTVATVPTVATMPTTTATAPVYRASIRDIVLFAVTDLGMFAALTVIYGFLSQWRDRVPQEWSDRIGQSANWIVAQGAIVIASAALLGLIVLLVVSIISSILRFYGFAIWRRGDDLVVVRGLLTRRTATVPVGRIQAITVKQSPLRRPFGLCSVGLGLSSSGAGDEDSGSNQALSQILPVIGTADVYRVLHDILPEWELSEPDTRRTGRGLARYYLIAPLAATLLSSAAIAILATLLDWPIWVTLAPAAIGVWWTACRWVKSRADGFAILPDADAHAAWATDDDNVADNAGASATGTVCADRTAGAPVAVMRGRIAVSGATCINRYVIFTRRARVQSFERATTMWREPRGIERVTMPLYVSEGVSSLEFKALRRADANRLERWAEAR